MSLTFAIARLSPTSASRDGIGLVLPLQEIDLARELTPLRGRADAQQELVAEERLLHEIDRTELHRLDGALDGAEAGHDDERGIDANVPQLAQHVDARRVRACACPTG